MIKTLDTYLDLCTQVYELSKPTPPNDAYQFYRNYVRNAKGLVLEPMCGTGRFLLPLLAEGFNVHGFDASKHMVDALLAKAKLQNLQPNVWEGFAENLDNKQKYQLIFIPAGSFGLITDHDAIKATLRAFYDHLADDGILLFEAETLKAAPEAGIWRGFKWQRPDGKMLLLSMFSTLEGNLCSSVGKYELVKGNQIIQTEIEEYKVKLYEPEELTTLLKLCGFKEINLIKAFDKNQIPDNDDEVIIYECRKA